MPSLVRGLGFLLLLQGVVLSSQAQSKVIEVDSITRLPSQPLPFDEPFTLKIPLKASDVSGVYCIELLRRKTLLETMTQRKLNNIHTVYPEFNLYPTTGDGAGYRVETFAKTRYLLLTLDARGATSQKLAAGVDLNDYKRAASQDIAARRAAEAAELSYDKLVDSADATAVKRAHETFAAAAKTAAAKARAVRQNRLLDPGRSYAFLYSTTTVSDEAWAFFDGYRRYKLSTSAVDFKNLQTFYAALYASNVSQTGIAVNLPLLTKPTKADFEKLLEQSPPKAWYQADEYNKLEDLERVIVPAMPAGLAPTAALSAEYSELARLIIQATVRFDSEQKALYLPAPRLASQRIRLLASLTTDTYAAIVGGFAPLDCNNCKPLNLEKDKRNYAARLANLKATLAAVTELATVAQELLPNSLVTKHLGTYQKAVQQAMQQLQAVTEQRADMAKRIADLRVGGYFTVSASTSILTFETRTKLSIGPDFGLVTTRPFSGRNNPYAFVPYLGFHVNFRPYNRDIPYLSYPHKFAHRLSAVIGWSLVNIDNGPRLAARPEQDSIASFFKAKGTLLTGLGVRLSSAVQLNAGAMWYFYYERNDSAPLPSLRYANRQLRPWPYLGITVDLSLKDILNDITSIFPAVPRSYVPPAATAN